MGLLMARSAEGDQILGSVIAQSAPRLNVMDLKTLDAPARLATPAVSVQDFQVELAISFRLKPQSWLFGTHPRQSVTWTSSSSSLVTCRSRASGPLFIEPAQLQAVDSCRP